MTMKKIMKVFVSILVMAMMVTLVPVQQVSAEEYVFIDTSTQYYNYNFKPLTEPGVYTVMDAYEVSHTFTIRGFEKIGDEIGRISFDYTSDAIGDKADVFVVETLYLESKNSKSLVADKHYEWDVLNEMNASLYFDFDIRKYNHYYINFMVGVFDSSTNTVNFEKVNVVNPYTYIAIEGIQIYSSEVGVGRSKKIEYQTYPYNAEEEVELSWISSDESVLTVDENGVMTGVSLGSAVIRCESTSGIVDDKKIYVRKTIENLSFDKEVYEFDFSAMNNQLKVSYNPEDVADYNELVWTSTNMSAVNANGCVSSSCNLSSVGPGEAIVTVTAPSGASASCKVIVDAPIKKVSIGRKDLKILKGSSFENYATITPNETNYDKTITWTSSRPEVASVDENGIIVGKNFGTAVITATASNGLSDSCNVKVIGGTPRIYGDDRYETAFLAAKYLKMVLGVEKFDAIIVASGTGFADALAGSYLAANKSAPIIMTNGKNVKDVHNYIKNNLIDGGTVYILGGTSAVSANVEVGLDKYTVRRLAGKNRYETNLAILNEVGVTTEDIIVATGTNFADSLSASATGLPILLVDQSLNGSQKEFLNGLSNNNFVIVGGSSAVNSNYDVALKAYGSGNVTRIAGKNRYLTSAEISNYFFRGNNNKIRVFAYAKNYPDGLSGGPIAYALDAPLLLVASGGVIVDSNTGYTLEDYLEISGSVVYSGVCLGGPKLITDYTVNRILGKQLDGSDPVVRFE